ncbi:hypothetical protein OBBRIDRAFT_623071 [Obba rivulosa]|uniref:Uncharacterized protein n=1 Tax=Obba rivulosa TaxID=1052685 RepID=A0A8E2AT78_9APHY|nr:hypothetical protein OBBRIDRAFT_623071 [Obba rivulosa]
MLPRRHRNARTAQDRAVVQSTRAMEKHYQHLISDVGKLTDEVSRLAGQRQKLQLEISELMRLKAEHSTNSFTSKPSATAIDTGSSPNRTAPPPPSSIPGGPRKSAWRPISPRQEVQVQDKGKGSGRVPPPSAVPEKRTKIVSWADWKPNAAFLPTPPPAPPKMLPPLPTPRASSPGLFGLRSPHSKPLPEMARNPR